jgi:tetratricopeptide (TPR) repeat protein
MDEMVNGLEPPRKSALGRTRKVLSKLLLIFFLSALLVLAAGIFYGEKAEVFRLPFFQKPTKTQLMPLPTEIQKLNFQDQFEEAKKEIEKGNYQLAYSILKNVQGRAQDKELIEKAAFYRGSLAANYMRDTDTALADFHFFLEKYPTSNFAAEAHYFLGNIYYDKKHDLVKAIDHFTILIERYPEHKQVPSAEFLLQDAAKQLTREGKNVGLITQSPLGAFLPVNKIPFLISLLGLLASIGMPIAWLLTQYLQSGNVNIDSVGSGLRKMARGIGWVVVFIVILSQIASFALTNYQSSMDFEKSTDALKRVGIQVDKK